MLYALIYSIEGLKLCTKRYYGIRWFMLEWQKGFKTMGKEHTMKMGINSMARGLNTNYTHVGFILGNGGGQVGAFNG